MRLPLKNLIVEQEERLEQIKRFAATLEELSGEEIRHPDFNIHHPLNAYRFIRNHSVIFNTTATKMLEEIRHYEAGKAKINEMLTNVKTVDQSELTGIIRGILVMQQVYELSATDIGNGVFGKYKVEPLTAVECKEIMYWAIVEKRYDLAEKWYNVALGKIEKEHDLTTTKRQLLLCRVSAYVKTRDFKLSYMWCRKLVQLDPRNRYHRYRLKQLQKLSKLPVYRPERNQTRELKKQERQRKFRNACQGITQRLLGPVPKHLHCDLFTNGGHPFLLLQPARREHISQNPLVELYHDVMSEKTILYLRNKYIDKIERSLVIRFKSDKIPDKHNMRSGGQSNPLRVSQTTTVPPESEISVMNFVAYTEAVTSLLRSSYETFKITDYGVGGQFPCHHDYFQVDDTEDNRFATFMIYMSDVEFGGGTAFPEINEVIFPKMGSALLWYNMGPNAYGNPNARHCGCPVVVGDKWISNIQIRRNNNEFSKPCPLQKNATTWS